MKAFPLNAVRAFDNWLIARWRVASTVSWAVCRNALACSFGRCGLRWEEVARIRPKDLGIENRTLFVRTAKGGPRRTIEVAGDLLEAALTMRAKLEGGHDRIFVSKDGRPWAEEYKHKGSRSGYNEIWRFVKAATLEVFGEAFAFHALRHTAAAELFKDTRDVFAVQLLLGHKSLRSTQVYLAQLGELELPRARAFTASREVESPRIFDPEGSEHGGAGGNLTGGQGKPTEAGAEKAKPAVVREAIARDGVAETEAAEHVAAGRGKSRADTGGIARNGVAKMEAAGGRIASRGKSAAANDAEQIETDGIKSDGASGSASKESPQGHDCREHLKALRFPVEDGFIGTGICARCGSKWRHKPELGIESAEMFEGPRPYVDRGSSGEAEQSHEEPVETTRLLPPPVDAGSIGERKQKVAREQRPGKIKPNHSWCRNFVDSRDANGRVRRNCADCGKFYGFVASKNGEMAFS